jgi:F0F1-type ATP synthase gamma subunit
LELRSKGIFLNIVVERPNNTFIQLRKKKVGPNRYSNIIKITHSIGKISKKKLKKRNSAIKKIEPGKPKKTKQFNKLIKKSFGHKKLIPLTSVIRRVLKRLLIASTSKNELVDNNA